jgi:16S rRNA (cytosine1402-N4)-methyltransferase
VKRDRGAAMAGQELQHIPVMLDEVLEGLALNASGRYLDGTFGRGGHARAILSHLSSDGRLFLMDRDPTAIAAAQAEFADDPRVAIRHDNFATMADWSETAGGLDGILLDLGVSSPQLDDAERGFSFMGDAPLDMRMDPTRGDSAADFIASADEREIADVLFKYGDERFSRRIAKTIVERREEQPILRTGELAALVAGCVGRREPGKNPATRTFQALRIRVNAELESISLGLDAALAQLKPGGRLAVISFHSLEDRIVKQFIRSHEGRVQGSRRAPPPTEQVKALLAPVGKARFPTDTETKANPRSRSAVLRVAEKLA